MVRITTTNKIIISVESFQSICKKIANNTSALEPIAIYTDDINYVIVFVSDIKCIDFVEDD